MEFVGVVKPFNLRSINVKELINEFFILTLTTIMFLFTSFVNDEDFKYDIAGWGFCFILSICIILNFAFIFSNIFNMIKLYWIKYYRRLKLRVDMFIEKHDLKTKLSPYLPAFLQKEIKVVEPDVL